MSAPTIVARFQGTSSSFVVMKLYNGKFAVEQHFEFTDDEGQFVRHQVFTHLDRAKKLAEQLARHS